MGRCADSPAGGAHLISGRTCENRSQTKGSLPSRGRQLYLDSTAYFHIQCLYFRLVTSSSKGQRSPEWLFFFRTFGIFFFQGYFNCWDVVVFSFCHFWAAHLLSPLPFHWKVINIPTANSEFFKYSVNEKLSISGLGRYLSAISTFFFLLHCGHCVWGMLLWGMTPNICWVFQRTWK